MMTMMTTTTTTTTTRTTTTFLPPLVSQPPLPPALTQHGDYANVAYAEHLARSGMELHHRRTGRGMQHEAAIERAIVAARMRRMEEEQIVRAARGVCALNDGSDSATAARTASSVRISTGQEKLPSTWLARHGLNVMYYSERFNSYSHLAGTGLACIFGVQAMINMGVAVRLLPAKGMTLPFVSYGGSSTLALCLCCGLLLALTRRNPFLDQSPYIGNGR